MKVLMLCPLWLPVSQNSRGGIETFLAQLIPTLQGLGVKIAVSATGDSETSAEVVSVTSRHLAELMDQGSAFEYVYYEQHQLKLALEQFSMYDVIHSHIGPGAFLLSHIPNYQDRVLHTLHWPIHVDLEWYVHRHPEMWLSTVSEFQARKVRHQGAARCHVIENGITVSEFTFQSKAGNALIFIGRIERVKGPDIAVQTALDLGRPLILAGPVMERNFFQQSIEPHLNSMIRYIGVVDHHQKNELYGQAGCAVLPFRREEPFGLVALEAMACGTPVVALARGALSEIIEPGLTGYLAQDEKEIPELINMALKLDRAAIRERVRERFDMPVVAEKYYQLYSKLAAS